MQAAGDSAAGLADIAPERVFAELKRIVAGPDPLGGVRLLDALALTEPVLPELAALHGVQQTVYHHLDVYEHTLAVLEQALEIERAPEDALGPPAAAVAARLREPLADQLTRGEALRFGALLHDIAKPRTRRALDGGRVGFPGHDVEGARMIRDILGRLRASERLTAHVAGLARHHLRLGFLVHERPLTRRQVYAYLQVTEPVTVDVTVLTVADRLATRGRKADQAIAAHLELAREMLGEALAWEARPRAPLVRGDELAAALGIPPGPELGRLLAEVEEARFAGDVATPEDAVALARESLRRAKH